MFGFLKKKNTIKDNTTTVVIEQAVKSIEEHTEQHTHTVDSIVEEITCEEKAKLLLEKVIIEIKEVNHPLQLRLINDIYSIIERL